MKIYSIIGSVLFCFILLGASAQVDSMLIDGQYYKIYPYPENVKVHNDYWLAVKDKDYYLDVENYFQVYGEKPTFNRQIFDSAEAGELELLNYMLKIKWKNLRSKDWRLGVGPKFVKQVRKHPEALIGPKYEFNKEVIPPFGAIPDGKYVQLFSEFCWVDSKGMCQPQTNHIAGYFDIKDNSIDGQAVWMNILGDTLKEGVFNKGEKEGEWKILSLGTPDRYFYGSSTKTFKKTGKFYLDTIVKIANYRNGILNGDYSQFWKIDKTLITGRFLNGNEVGNWRTYYDTALIRNVTYANSPKAIFSKKPIIRTGAFFSGSNWEFNFDDYTYHIPDGQLHHVRQDRRLYLTEGESGLRRMALDYLFDINCYGSL